jgi:DNA-nicking Smr family endonuclease
MDFGDILDEWDRRTARAAGKGRAALKRSPDRGERPDPLTVWLRKNDIYDKDAEEGGKEPQAGERRFRLLRKRPDAVIDLHGLTRDEAWRAMEGFFRSVRQRGFEKVLIIHGKGNHSEEGSILKELSREFIETCPFAGESGYEDTRSGGTGATWVLLKSGGRDE